MKGGRSNWRINFIFFILILIASGIITRLFSIQVSNHGFYVSLAKGQYQLFEKLIPQRGRIYIQDKTGRSGISLAINREYLSVYAAPREIEEKEKTAEILAFLLEMDKDFIKKRIDKPDDPYEPLKDKLDDDTARKIKDLNLKGIYLMPKNWRWYPQNEIVSHLTGFVGFRDDKQIGQYGLEGYYENKLVGEYGFLRSEKDAKGKWIWNESEIFQPAKDGDDLILTIDQNIQFKVEQKLKTIFEKWQAESASVIIMDPKTGAIKAMANQPNYNLNEYSKVENIDIFLNACIQKSFEPGSVFKPITMAIGLDTQKITPETTYIDTGSVVLNNKVIKNALNNVYGLSTMTKVLEKSINTGAIFVERLVGSENFLKYVEAFGFGKLTGIDLDGEITNNISNIKIGKPDINFATASFGQGISVTPIQMISAIGAIANEGKLMRPYIVDKIIHYDGTETLIQPEFVRQVISPQAASKLTAMLVSTVRNGYDKININNYFIAGKTGTAQVSSLDEEGYTEDTIHSFVGYAPAYNPKFIIFIKLEKPKDVKWASGSLIEPFTELTKYLLDYYEIPPDE